MKSYKNIANYKAIQTPVYCNMSLPLDPVTEGAAGGGQGTCRGGAPAKSIQRDDTVPRPDHHREALC